MSVLCLVHGADDELSQQAVAFASGLGLGDVRAVARGRGLHAGRLGPDADRASLTEPTPSSRPAPIAATRCSPTWRPSSTSRWPPTVTVFTAGSPATVRRVRWGGSLLEEATLDGRPLLFTVAAHVVAAAPIAAVDTVAVSDGASDADRVVTVSDTVAAAERVESR